METNNKLIKSTNSIKNLIMHIKIMYYNDDPLLDNVDDVNMLYNALCELDEIVGMYEVKESIVQQIKFLLVNSKNNGKHKFENHMLHTVIFGPPGVGKTTVGACLANIWKALGLIKNKKEFEELSVFAKTIKDSKTIRILPIPIFLIKKQNNAESSNVIDNKNTANNKHNKKIFMEYPDSHINCIEIDNDHKQYNFAELTDTDVETTTNKKKYLNSINKNILELECEIQMLMHEEKDSLDDKRKYIKELSKYKTKIRNFKLLSHGIENLKSKKTKLKYKNKLKRSKFDSPIKIVSRPDFVGQYVGHTCDKTQKLLTTTLEEGKVLFIDEAYSIVIDEKDSFGNEAINELNRFMSENPSLVIIFAGYKDKMESTLFQQQPGLSRRISWKFEITNYTGDMLANIFIKQLAKDDWKFEGNEKELNNFFQLKIKNFDSFGGDTLRLAFYCKLTYSELKFDFAESNQLKDKTITFDIVKTAYLNIYCKNKPEKENRETWRDLYN